MNIPLGISPSTHQSASRNRHQQCVRAGRLRRCGQPRDGFRAEVAVLRDGPFIILFQQDGPDQAHETKPRVA